MASDPPADETGQAQYPVKIVLRDGTAIFGDLAGITGGHIAVETHRGKLTIAGEQVRSITPIESIPPRLGRWQHRPVTPMEKQALSGKLRQIKGDFVEAFSAPTGPAAHKAFHLMWRISAMALMLQDHDLPLQIVGEARESNASNKTGMRRGILTGCEAIAHGVLGDTAKSRNLTDSLSGYMKKQLMTVMKERGVRRGGPRWAPRGDRGRGSPKRP